MEFSITPDHCRVCLKRTPHGKFLHDKFALELPSTTTGSAENRSYLDIYQLVTGANLSPKPSGAAFFPQRICDNCEAQLLVAHEFRRKSGRSERVLANVLSLYDDEGGSGKGEPKEEPIEEMAVKCSESESNLEDTKESVDETLDSGAEKDPFVETNLEPVPEYEIVTDAGLDQDDEIGYIIEEEFMEDDDDDDETESYGEDELCEVQLTEPKSKTSLCPDCGKVVSYRYLKTHRETHKDNRIKPFECDQCQARFTLKENLQKHKRIHSQDKKYSCPYCQQKFLHWASRRYHIDSRHTGELRFTCEYCGAKFRNSSHYVVHLRGHKGVTPYACHMCDRSFTNGQSLKHHLVTHSDIKSFNCSHENCTKSYKTRKALRIHIRTAHEQEKNYICPVCGKAYSQNHVLKTHLLRHHPHFEPPPPGTVVSSRAIKKKNEQMALVGGNA